MQRRYVSKEEPIEVDHSLPEKGMDGEGTLARVYGRTTTVGFTPL